MGANDGAVLAFRQLANNGPNNLRYNIVLVSEGYTVAEIPLFQSHCKGFLRKLFWTAPYSALRGTINVFALEVSSTDSGIDDPLTCADTTTGSGSMPATFFDASMCGWGVRRLISIDSGAVRNRVAGFLPQWNSILVLVNSSLSGGVQSDVAVFTTEAGWEDTALHEFSHVLGLADEYPYYVSEAADGGRRYDWFDAIVRGFGLPDQPNVTDKLSLTGAKWANLINTTLPPPHAPGSVPAGTVGLFEGAKYYAFGLYRPEENCKMRNSGAPFCAVCRAEITRKLAPWTPSTPFVEPTATPASLTLTPRLRGKVMLSPGKGGYEIALDRTTNLPATATWSYSLDRRGRWLSLPASRTIRVAINESPGTYIYDHSVEVRAQVGVGDLDYWVPATPDFTSAQQEEPIVLPKPNNAINAILSDYANPGNVEGTGSASLNFGGIISGNGWLYVAVRKYYARLAARLRLDPGHFGPDDNPAWGLQSVNWTPRPSQTAGLTAFYDVTFDAGLCWLESDPKTVVDPHVGFPVSASGRDAIGQSFGATGWLVPTNEEYSRSISTIEVPKIPEWEWPVLFDIRAGVLEVVFEGVLVMLTLNTLQIGSFVVELKDARQAIA